jgi:hypothetical protein
VFIFAGLEVLTVVLMKMKMLCCVNWQIILSDVLKNHNAFTFGVKQFKKALTLYCSTPKTKVL